MTYRLGLSVSILIALVSCSKLPEAELTNVITPELGLRLSTSPDMVPAAPGAPTATDKEFYYGFCGDGIRNGSEYCDGQDMWFYSLQLLTAYLEAPLLLDCTFDISDCLTQAVDKHIGGRAETCKC